MRCLPGPVIARQCDSRARRSPFLPNYINPYKPQAPCRTVREHHCKEGVLWSKEGNRQSGRAGVPNAAKELLLQWLYRLLCCRFLATKLGVVQTSAEVPFPPEHASVEAEWKQDSQTRTITVAVAGK